MKYKPYAWAIGLTLCTTVSTSSFATTTELLDLSSMTEAASTIVTAEVVSSQVDSSNNRGKTMVTLRVTDEIKGNPQELITITLPNGSYSRGRFRVGQVSAGVPQLFPNQDALLFLSEGSQSNNYSIVGYSQGYMAIRNEEGQQVLQNTTTGGQEITVSAMKKQILDMEAN